MVNGAVSLGVVGLWVFPGRAIFREAGGLFERRGAFLASRRVEGGVNHSGSEKSQF